MKISVFTFLFLILISCNSIRESRSLDNRVNSSVSQYLLELNSWYLKDNNDDKIPGISLDKWYNKNNNRAKLNSIVVAVIDTQIDINHEDLIGQLWNNEKEIPENGIDDDKNGYVDDVNGWSFIGTKTGGSVIWSNFEYVRIIRKWDAYFKNKTKDQIDNSDLYHYNEYLRALNFYERNYKFYNNYLKSLRHSVEVYPLAKDTLKYYFPKEDYTYQQLDSMYKIYKSNDKTYNQRRDDNDRDFGALIQQMMSKIQTNTNSLAIIKEKLEQQDSIVNKNLNIDYNERILIGDNPELLEKGYGNKNVSNYKKIQNHSTKVSSLIGGNRLNNVGVKGFSENIKIMPLNISPSGDEHDKDIVMAIRYAVDNGAKVINMSIGKEFSMHKEWLLEALKYAEKKNVLIVHSAGNSKYNVDENPYYPCDFDDKSEISNNFINVGSTTKNLDNTFVSTFSNFGKKNVDLFAPGDQIYTAIPDNKYEFDSGTSLAAPMVSGTAALIWLYYPKLTSSEVKQIILDSGSAYDIEVLIPGGQGKKTKFSELSKSGKVLNVYNAMKMAEEVSNKKKVNK